MTGTRVFVTGGNGFIGSRVVRALLTRGYAVRCLLRPTSATGRIDGLEFTRAVGDLRDPESLKAGMAGCQGVIHLACTSSWDQIRASTDMNEVAVTGTQNVLSAAHVNGGLRTVYVSSITAVNGTDTPQIQTELAPFTLTDRKRYAYAFAKHEAEARCQEAVQAGLPVTIVNPAEVYGPEDVDLVTAGNLVDFAKSNPVFVCRGGTSVVHVDDVAAGIVAAFEKGRVGERYILGGENLTIEDLARTSLDVLGRKKRIVILPNGFISRLADLGRTLRLPLPFEPGVIPYAVKYWFADATKAQTELGIRFRSALETLKPTLEWLQSTGRIR